MKITIEIEETNARAAQKLALIMNSQEFYDAVWELNANMHNKFKHKEWSDDQWLAYYDVREWLLRDVFSRCIDIIQLHEDQ